MASIGRYWIAEQRHPLNAVLPNLHIVEAILARKLKIQVSKTRIRHHIRRIAEHAVENIDHFRDHIYQGRAARQRSLEKFAEKLPPESQEFLADEFHQLDTISHLGDQLSIVALYRVVELNVGRMLAHEFGITARRKASDIRSLRKFLKQKESIDLKSVPHYRAIDELRLLNNAIKHSGRVTKELAKYRRWTEGDELIELREAYETLRPKVPPYIFRLAERMKLRYK